MQKQIKEKFNQLQKNINYYTNTEEEVSLEEQISEWQTNDFNSEKKKGIILGDTNLDNMSDVIIDNHVYNDVEFFNTMIIQIILYLVRYLRIIEQYMEHIFLKIF